MISLEEVSEKPPEGAVNLLTELGDGESGFSGTDVGTGRLSMSEYLRKTMRETNGEALPDGWVPQTTYWILDGKQAAGILRLRHSLNDNLRIVGGHIGYYVKPDSRKKGIARQALRLALQQARARQIEEVMLTTHPNNTGSIRVIEANGGILRGQVTNPDDGSSVNQYWIDL